MRQPNSLQSLCLLVSSFPRLLLRVLLAQVVGLQCVLYVCRRANKILMSLYWWNNLIRTRRDKMGRLCFALRLQLFVTSGSEMFTVPYGSVQYHTRKPMWDPHLSAWFRTG